MSAKINFLKFCFLLLFVFKSFSYSQISDISFDHLFLEDGLSQSIVKSIIQDSDGFMYFGTEDGLNIFDAYSFKIFRNTDDYNSISYNDITSLCEDKYGKVWIGTFNSGISLYIPEKQKFHRFVFDANNPNSLSNNNINAITTDSKDNVWIGTDNGLSQFEPSSIEMNEYFVNRGIKLRNGKIALNKIKILSLFLIQIICFGLERTMVFIEF